MDIAQQTIRIEGVCYNEVEVKEWRRKRTSDDAGARQELEAFLTEWFDTKDTLLVHTSGSTGAPKPMRVEKARMMASACLTCSFLGLHEGDTALLCMPLKYIAGKMVVVRSLVAGLDLWPIPPSGHPLKGLAQAPVFAAMIPMQVYNSLQVAEEKKVLRQIKSLIIGGGAIDDRLNEELQQLPNAVWSTYGMTETLSHIALRRLNGPDASDWYTPLEGVDVRLSEEGTLIVCAPRVGADELVTNDIAEINSDNQFRILGRKDNTVNSGGVKVQIEQVEAALKGYISRPFLVTSVPDEKFGEIVVLLIEGEMPVDMASVYECALPAYHRPKRTIPVLQVPMTETGKPDRCMAKKMAKKNLLL